MLSVFSTGVYAQEIPGLSAEVTKDGNTVELTLSISENSNIAGCSFNIVYDSRILTYSSHQVMGTISTTINMVNPHYNANAIRMLWADTKELTAGGEVMKVTFEINDGATESTEIVIDKLKMLDIDSQAVECTSENATVVISESTVVGGGSTGSAGSSSGNTTGNKPEAENKPEAPTTEPDIPTTDSEVTLFTFSDVKESDWFFESVKFAEANKLMNGVSANKFAPMNNLTRGMLVTILYRLAGEPESSASSFADVEASAWYSNGIAWAAENKVVNGVGDNKFAPNANITREQIALIMYNYSKLKGVDTTETQGVDAFSDADKVSDWAKDAVEWSVGAGILSGKGSGVLDPKGNATRAEIATILMRYIKKYN